MITPAALALRGALNGHTFTVDGKTYQAIYDYPGIVMVTVSETREIYATPDYDCANEIPIQVNHDAEVVDGDVFDIQWTGDVAADLAKWVDLVTPSIRRHGADVG